MKEPFFLIPDVVSHDTIGCLEALLREARAGRLIGVAYCAMLRKRAYIVNSAGEAHRNPTFTRGMLQALDDQLSQRVDGVNL